MTRHDESISDRLRRMAATDELKVGRGRAEQIASRALARAQARPHRRARLAAAIVSGSAFAIVSVTGVGAIADQAVPGDSLYPVDRAYETITRAIGRDVDRTQERLEEAQVLAERGEKLAAFNHVNAELGQRIPVDPPGSPLVAAGADADQVVTPSTEAVAADEAAAPSAAVAAVEAAPAPVQDAAPVEDSDVVDGSDAPNGDPFVLALENAIRAIEAAAESQDEDAVLAADEAVRSVVRLAAGQVTADEQVEPAAPGAVTAASTTTTTSPETAIAADEDADEAGGNDPADGSTPANPQNGQTGSTTTTVPVDDSGEEPPGDGETAGDEPGGGQEGSGSAGEPGDGGGKPPVILPIP